MNSISTTDRRPWWIMVAVSVAIVGSAATVAQRGSLHADAPRVLPSGSKAAVIPAMFLKMPGGRFAARASDLTVELDVGGRVQFSAGLKLSLDGARRDVQPEGIDDLKAKVSFFAGSDPSDWQAALPAFGGRPVSQPLPGN